MPLIKAVGEILGVRLNFFHTGPAQVVAVSTRIQHPTNPRMMVTPDINVKAEATPGQYPFLASFQVTEEDIGVDTPVFVGVGTPAPGTPLGISPVLASVTIPAALTVILVR